MGEAATEVEIIHEPKKEGKSKKKIIVLALAGLAVLVVCAILAFFLVGTVMWQLGIFNTSPMTLTSTGFAKIKPQLAGTVYSSDGTFRTILTNGVGAPIVLDEEGIGLTETQKQVGCTSATLSKTAVNAGENFELSAVCPTALRGEVFSISLEIPYAVTIGGSPMRQADSGFIRGPVY